ncbi:MAG: lytic transglycosylase domain-containing protein [Steroidobacteraceae bacterium]
MKAWNFTPAWRTLLLAIVFGHTSLLANDVLAADSSSTGARVTQTGNPQKVDHATTTYDRIIEEAAQRHGVNAALVRAVVKVESNFRADARSPKGALGLMQLLPSTALELGATTLFDPYTNVDAGTRHLKRLLQRYAGSAELALAAYNAGEGAVEKHGRAIPPYPETESYVRKVLSHLGASSSSAGLVTAGTARPLEVSATKNTAPVANATPIVVGGVWTNISNISTYISHGN